MLKKIYNKLRLRFYKWNQRRFKPDYIPIYQELSAMGRKYCKFLGVVPEGKYSMYEMVKAEAEREY